MTPVFDTTDTAVFIVNTRDDWTIIKLEVSDGFYHPVCAITRVVLDHFNVAVLVSFGVVGLTYAIYWAPFVSGKGLVVLLLRFVSCQHVVVTFHTLFRPSCFMFDTARVLLTCRSINISPRLVHVKPPVFMGF